MREGTFHEEHDVELTEEERNIYGRQAARLTVAFSAHEEKAKEIKKKLKEDGDKIEEAGFEAAQKAETGKERRMVECAERLIGATVVTERLDTKETVSTRPATQQELRGEDRAKNEKAKQVPPEDRDARIRREIVELCARGRTEALLLKALAKGLPNTTEAERKAAVNQALEAGAIVEQDGKLVVSPTAPPPEARIVLPDDYKPEGAPAH